MILMYRYEDVLYASAFDDEWVGPGRLVVELRVYEIIRRTAKGCWVRAHGSSTSRARFVLSTAKRQFACHSVEEARSSFLARKKRQAEIHKRALKRALDAISQMGGDARSTIVDGEVAP